MTCWIIFVMSGLDLCFFHAHTWFMFFCLIQIYGDDVIFVINILYHVCIYLFIHLCIYSFIHLFIYTYRYVSHTYYLTVLFWYPLCYFLSITSPRWVHHLWRLAGTAISCGVFGRWKEINRAKETNGGGYYTP